MTEQTDVLAMPCGTPTEVETSGFFGKSVGKYVKEHLAKWTQVKD